MFGWIKNMFNKSKGENVGTEKDIRYLEYLINTFLSSKKRMDMLTGERYYKGIHDILFTKREVIGEGGRLTEIGNIPNNKRIDNQYEKLVDQKTNYLLGRPIAFKTENEDYTNALNQIFNTEFHEVIKSLGEDCFNNGIGWLYPHYNSNGDFSFKKFEPTEILPIWKDEDHKELEFIIRIYTVQEWTGSILENVEKVEIYGTGGIDKYGYRYGSLKYEGHHNYFTFGDQEYNWNRIPIIPFKYNVLEKPLINRVKTLQDGLNKAISMFENGLDENPRNSILIIENYDGENLGEFRRNLSAYGAVKVRDNGDLRALTIEINPENYKSILKIFKDAIIENARGFNAKDERMSNNPNEMNIQSMYSDIDLDANGMETLFQSSLNKVLWFVNNHLNNIGVGDFEKEKVEIIFNKDILINEAQTIENIAKSVGIISEETLISMHPYVSDPKAELERMKKEKEEKINQYTEAFGNGPGDPDGKEE